jgi:hypothetical protein
MRIEVVRSLKFVMAAVLPGGRGHRKITQNRPYKNIFGGGKFIAVNRP